MNLKLVVVIIRDRFGSLPSLHMAAKMSELKKRKGDWEAVVRESSQAFQMIAFTVAEL